MAEPRILIVGASPSLSAALVAALAGAARVVVVEPGRECTTAPVPVEPLRIPDDFLLAELRTPDLASPGYGPTLRRAKGKDVRWNPNASPQPIRGTRGRIF